MNIMGLSLQARLSCHWIVEKFIFGCGSASWKFPLVRGPTGQCYSYKFISEFFNRKDPWHFLWTDSFDFVEYSLIHLWCHHSLLRLLISNNIKEPRIIITKCRPDIWVWKIKTEYNLIGNYSINRSNLQAHKFNLYL